MQVSVKSYKYSKSKALKLTGSLEISRTQVPCSPAFAIIDYRAQGRTFERVALDLEVGRGGTTGHKNFAGLYVMLLRGISSSGVLFVRWF